MVTQRERLRLSLPEPEGLARLQNLALPSVQEIAAQQRVLSERRISPRLTLDDILRLRDRSIAREIAGDVEQPEVEPRVDSDFSERPRATLEEEERAREAQVEPGFAERVSGLLQGALQLPLVHALGLQSPLVGPQALRERLETARNPDAPAPLTSITDRLPGPLSTDYAVQKALDDYDRYIEKPTVGSIIGAAAHTPGLAQLMFRERSPFSEASDFRQGFVEGWTGEGPFPTRLFDAFEKAYEAADTRVGVKGAVEILNPLDPLNFVFPVGRIARVGVKGARAGARAGSRLGPLGSARLAVARGALAGGREAAMAVHQIAASWAALGSDAVSAGRRILNFSRNKSLLTGEELADRYAMYAGHESSEALERARASGQFDERMQELYTGVMSPNDLGLAAFSRVLNDVGDEVKDSLYGFPEGIPDSKWGRRSHGALQWGARIGARVTYPNWANDILGRQAMVAHGRQTGEGVTKAEIVAAHLGHTAVPGFDLIRNPALNREAIRRSFGPRGSGSIVEAEDGLVWNLGGVAQPDPVRHSWQTILERLNTPEGAYLDRLLTPEQQLLFLREKTYHRIGFAMLRDEGVIDDKLFDYMLETNYTPRFTAARTSQQRVRNLGVADEALADFETVIEQFGNIRGPLSRQTPQFKRVFPDIEEALGKGYQYQVGPEAMRNFFMTVYHRINRKHLEDRMEALTKRNVPKEAAAEKLKTRAAEQYLAQVDRLAQSASRGSLTRDRARGAIDRLQSLGARAEVSEDARAVTAQIDEWFELTRTNPLLDAANRITSSAKRAQQLIRRATLEADESVPVEVERLRARANGFQGQIDNLNAQIAETETRAGLARQAQRRAERQGRDEEAFLSDLDRVRADRGGTSFGAARQAGESAARRATSRLDDAQRLLEQLRASRNSVSRDLSEARRQLVRLERTPKVSRRGVEQYAAIVRQVEAIRQRASGPRPGERLSREEIEGISGRIGALDYDDPEDAILNMSFEEFVRTVSDKRVRLAKATAARDFTRAQLRSLRGNRNVDRERLESLESSLESLKQEAAALRLTPRVTRSLNRESFEATQAELRVRDEIKELLVPLWDSSAPTWEAKRNAVLKVQDTLSRYRAATRKLIEQRKATDEMLSTLREKRTINSTRYGKLVQLDPERFPSPRSKGWFFTEKEAEGFNGFLLNPRSKAHNLIQFGDDAAGVLRWLRTTFDFGAPFIQLAVVMFSRPDVFARAVFYQMRRFTDPEGVRHYMVDNMPTLLRMSQHGIPINTAQFEQFIATSSQRQPAPAGDQGTGGKAVFPTIGDKITTGTLKMPDSATRDALLSTQRGIGRALGATSSAFEGAFNTTGMVARTELWKGLEPSWLAHNGDLDELGSFINHMTGFTNLSAAGFTRFQESAERAALFFAPRYTRSVLALVHDAMAGNIRGRQARQALMGMATVLPLMYLGFTRALGQDAKVDPRPKSMGGDGGEFFTVNVGGTNIGLGTLWIQLARLIGALGGTDPEDIGNYVNPQFRGNPFVEFIRKRLPPTGDFFWSLVAGRTYIGEPLNTMGEAAAELGKGSLPFAVETVLFENGSKDAGITGGSLIGGIAEFFGARQFPVTLYEQLLDERNRAAISTYGERWDDLNRGQQNALARSPDNEIDVITEGLDEELSDYAPSRGGDGETEVLLRAYFDLTQSADDEWRRRVTEIHTLVEEGSIDTATFRDILAEANTDRAAAVRLLRNDPAFEGVFQALRESAARKDRLLPAEDYAFFEYVQTVIAQDLTDKFGRYDFAAREQLEIEFARRWNNEIVDYVRTRFATGRETEDFQNPNLLKELYYGREQFRFYWEDVTPRVVETFRRSDEIARKLERYDDLIDELDRERLIRSDDDLARAARLRDRAEQNLRESNRDLDIFLFRFGYTRTLRHPENQFEGAEDFYRSGLIAGPPYPETASIPRSELR